MARESNFLLGNGERLTSTIKIVKSSGDKNPPYSFDEARDRVTSRLEGAVEQFSSLPSEACPGDRVVAVLTLHPRYTAKSEFPAELLRKVNLQALGSRARLVKPDNWGITRGVPPTGDYYTCRDSAPSRRPDGIVCNSRHYRARDLERGALAAVREALASPDAIAAAIAQARSEMALAAGQGADAGRVAAMERQERAAMQAEIAAIADGRDPEPYRRLLREIASKRAGMGQGPGASVAPALARLASRPVPALCALLARAMERIENSETTDETRSRVLSSVVRSVTPDEKGNAMLTELQPLTAGATVERITIRSTVGGRLERVQVVWDEQGEGGAR